jgi:hypothetical protein
MKINIKREFYYSCQKVHAYTLLVNILLRRIFQVGQLIPIMREVVGTELLVSPFKALKQAGT